MKTALDILRDKSFYNKWLEELTIYEEDLIVDLMEEYATEYAKEALMLASENATVECEGDEFSHSYIVYKQSILSESNLPKR